jgi:predicted cupin superfamily sugar epimerase
MSETAESIIAALGLAPHPEGGAYFETYRHAESRGDRALATAIYFLLRGGQVSEWHRVTSDELWFFHAGDPLTLKLIGPEGEAQDAGLGLRFAAGERPQVLVPAGYWQAAVPAPEGAHGWTLVSCMVAPGFDFADFEMCDEAAMRQRYPGLGDRLALRRG